MVSRMSDLELETVAAFYGISVEEARVKNERCLEQGDNPAKPICVGCARVPSEIDGYTSMLDDWDGDADSYVIENEGTYNRQNGHFLCDPCYIKNGCPSSPRGWKCP